MEGIKEVYKDMGMDDLGNQMVTAMGKNKHKSKPVEDEDDGDLDTIVKRVVKKKFKTEEVVPADDGE